MYSRRHHTRGRARTGGFTLIEILVAMAVIAVALTAVVAESSQHLGNAARLQERTLAHWVAMNRVAEAQLSDTWPAIGTTTGRALMSDREWFWTLSVSETADEDVRRIDVEVRRDREARRPLASVIAYLGRPSR